MSLQYSPKNNNFYTTFNRWKFLNSPVDFKENFKENK